MTQAQTRVIFYTNYGEFEVEMYDSLAPITSGNFLDLVSQGYYDGVIFHRVIDNFMIQGGDPTGTGSGGPGYSIEDEFHPDLSNVQKTISMANSGPNTGGSQFFINLVNNTYLDYNKPPFTSKHPVFGIVVRNFEVVQTIGKVQTGSGNRPVDSVVMDSVRIQPDPSPYTHLDVPSMTLMPNPILPTGKLVIQYNRQYHDVESHLVVRSYYTGRSEVFRFPYTIRAGYHTEVSTQLFWDALPSGIYVVSDSKLGVGTKMVIAK